jgi:hypothetical protein
MRADIQKKLRQSKQKNQLKEEMCINNIDNNKNDQENINNEDIDIKSDNIYKNLIYIPNKNINDN